MNCKVRWSPQVENYVRSKAPEPRTELWREIKRLAEWDGRENPPRLKHLEGSLVGYSRLKVHGHRIIFREAFVSDCRAVECLFAAPRNTVYEAFEEMLLDSLS